MTARLLRNGTIRTCVAPGHALEAIGVLGDRIVAPARVADGEAVDLGGRCVVPGLADSHVHFPTWALVQGQLRLEGTASAREVIARVAGAAAGAGADRWLRGYGWREGDWSDGPRAITRELADALDAASGDVPVVLTSRDYHSVWVNAAGLARAGGHDLGAGPGAVVELDDAGRPLGILRETAAWRFRDAVARPTHAELLAATRAALPIAHARGVTSVHDKDGWLGALPIWEELRAAGELSLRVWQSLPPDRLDELEALGVRSGFGDDRLRIGYVKLFADSALGSGTALLTDGGGVAITSPGELREHVVRAARAGFPVAIHAIGDLANQRVLDVFEATREEWRPRGLRQRIEHAQLLRWEDVPRFAELGVAASVQFAHQAADRDLADRAWAGMTDRTYPFKALADAGVRLCNGSDAPVDELDPLYGLRVGVQRSGDGRAAWHPEQCLSAEQALRATTVDPAWLACAEDRLGSLAPGRLADLVVLDRDPLACPADELAEVAVVATMLDGEWIHNPPPWD